MRVVAALISCFALAAAGVGTVTGQNHRGGPESASGDTHLSVHNIHSAHEITLGSGTKVGILDHSFEMASHPELYAGGKVFSEMGSSSARARETHHGYWMALTLREVAPESRIFALEIPTKGAGARVDAMVEAMDWAVEQDLDVVTYCGGEFSPAERAVLDLVIEKTVQAGIVVVFVDYPHPLNLLPGGFGGPSEAGDQSPDLNIFSYDCTALFGNGFVAFMEPDDDVITRHRPFLARPAAGSVTAGVVALVRSVSPEASPREIKKVLVATSRPVKYRGLTANRVPDAFEAVTSVQGVGTAGPRVQVRSGYRVGSEMPR